MWAAEFGFRVGKGLMSNSPISGEKCAAITREFPTPGLLQHQRCPGVGEELGGEHLRARAASPCWRKRCSFSVLGLRSIAVFLPLGC